MKAATISLFILMSFASYGQYSERIDSLNGRAKSFIRRSMDSLDIFLSQSLAEVDSNKYPQGYAEAYNILSIKLMQQGQFDSSLFHLKNNLNLYSRLGDEGGLARTNGNIGNIYRIRGENLEAIKYLLIALDFFEKEGFREAIGGTLLNIGIIYSRLERFNDALAYYERALEVFQELSNPMLIASCQLSIGNIYKNLGKYDQAIIYQRRAIENSGKSNNVMGVADSYGNLGEIFLLKENYDSSVAYISLAIKNFSAIKDSTKLSVAYATLADAQYQLGEIDGALRNAKVSIRLANDSKFVISNEKIAEVMMNIYSDLGNYKEAFKYSQIYTDIKDSLYNNEKSAAIARLEAENEFEKKEQQLRVDQELRESLLEQKNQRNILLSAGAIGGLLLIALFIYWQYRQRNKYAKVVEEKNEQLSETMASKEKLFSVIAHDLKSPLSALSSISSTLAENIESFEKEQIATFLKKFEKSSQNLTDLLNNLLQWSLSQTGSLKVQPEKLDIKKSMERAIEPLIDLAESRGVSLSVDSDELSVLADERMLETIIRNLVSNALKFTDNGGQVNLSTEKSQDNLIVKVQDSGIGMGQEEVSRLFDIKFDPNKIGDHEEKGTGLGLILSKELVEKNNGTIGVKSERNNGSTFYFTLPLAA